MTPARLFDQSKGRGGFFLTAMVLYEDGTEDIFWRGANPEDVNKFMTDFINIYKQSGTSLLFSS